MNETYGIIREIIIDNSQEFFKNKYKKSDDKFRKAQFVIGIISGIPKFIIEYILILIIFIFVYNLLFTYNYNSSHVLPLVSSFAFVAYRSMPLLNNIYSSIAQISGYKESVLEGINLLNEIKLLKKQNHEDLTNSNIDLKFNLSLSLKNVNFTYPDNSEKVLKKHKYQFRKR